MMSLVAEGLLVALHTDWPEDLRINAENLRERYPDIGGRDKTRKVMAELVANGHLIKHICRFNNGYMTVYVLTENQAPLLKQPAKADTGNQAPHVQPVPTGKCITVTSQVDNIVLTNDETTWSDPVSETRPLRQYVATSYLYKPKLTKLGTSYPPDLAVGGEVPVNKWKDEEPSVVFGSVPEDKPQRPKTKREIVSASKRSVKDKSQWSTSDVVFYFRDLLALKRPMDCFFAEDKALGSMKTFRLNHQTTPLEETQLAKDFLTLSQHLHPSMSAQQVWWKFLTYAAANLGRVRTAVTAAPAMTYEEAEAILAASMERLMSL